MFIDNPAYDYDNNRPDYTNIRKPDPRIAEAIRREIGEARKLVNIGAGAGAYEPRDIPVTAVEPSEAMREIRLSKGISPAINATAEDLPFEEDEFDVALATFTIHHWPDLKVGLNEVRRVTKQRIVLLTVDPERLHSYWSKDYFGEVLAVEKARYPRLDRIQSCLSSDKLQIHYIDVPRDCEDGFQEAFYARPEAFLESEVRKAQSAWGFIGRNMEIRLVEKLRADLRSGEWDRKYGHYRNKMSLKCGLCLVTFHLQK